MRPTLKEFGGSKDESCNDKIALEKEKMSPLGNGQRQSVPREEEKA